MKIVIKNMVCARCIIVVNQILTASGLDANNVILGEVDLIEKPSDAKWLVFKEELEKAGFELLDDQKMQRIEKIKKILIQKVQEGKVEEHFSLSAFLGGHIFKNYSYLSKTFSEIQGITIEHFFILQKVEKAKEWLLYNELSVSEIAMNLGYSSSQNFSSQFRKITGYAPSDFKKVGLQQRKFLDSV